MIWVSMALREKVNICSQPRIEFVNSLNGFFVNTSFRRLKLNCVAWRTLVAVISHYHIHPVVTIRNQTSQCSGKARSICFKTLGFYSPAHSVPGQTAAFSPIVHLRNQIQLHQCSGSDYFHIINVLFQ